ncbi:MULTISPECIES: hypothetical protein [Calothrix]|uniref:hypothetical protein n=1 Tax=Calothrix TaxID=1186 RepID=UPI001F557768|nr:MULTISPECIES: hypothetical protein [Calothrix]
MLYYRNWQLLLFLISPFIAIGIHFLPIIPSWVNIQFCFSIAIWLITLVVGLLLFKKPQPLPIVKTRILIIIHFLITTLIFLFVLFIIYVASAFDAPSIETLIYKEYSQTIYLYNYTCAPPDTSTECGTYHGELKLRINFTPFMRTKFTCPCLFGTPETIDNFVFIPLEYNRDKKLSKVKINLKTGEIVLVPS